VWSEAPLRSSFFLHSVLANSLSGVLIAASRSSLSTKDVFNHWRAARRRDEHVALKAPPCDPTESWPFVPDTSSEGVHEADLYQRNTCDSGTDDWPLS